MSPYGDWNQPVSICSMFLIFPIQQWSTSLKHKIGLLQLILNTVPSPRMKKKVFQSTVCIQEHSDTLSAYHSSNSLGNFANTTEQAHDSDELVCCACFLRKNFELKKEKQRWPTKRYANQMLNLTWTLRLIRSDKKNNLSIQYGFAENLHSSTSATGH